MKIIENVVTYVLAALGMFCCLILTGIVAGVAVAILFKLWEWIGLLPTC
jgi:hypothetical protein